MKSKIPPPSLGKLLPKKLKKVKRSETTMDEFAIWQKLMREIIELEGYHRTRWKPLGFKQIRAIGYGTLAHFRISVYATKDGRQAKKIVANVNKSCADDWRLELDKAEWQPTDDC